MDPAERPPWLEFLSFGDSREVRFPLLLMGCAVVGFVTLLEAADGWDRHLEHIVPFSLGIALVLAWRWRLVRAHPEPLGPM
jgi:hypothetical protein